MEKGPTQQAKVRGPTIRCGQELNRGMRKKWLQLQQNDSMVKKTSKNRKYN